jgi:hypothetical protein
MTARQPILPLVTGPLPPHDPVTGELLFDVPPAATASAPSAQANADGGVVVADRSSASGGFAPRPSGFGGFSPCELVTMAMFALLLLWAAWATRELLILKDRRTVSVSLATMVQEFVAAEARRGANQQDAAARTKAYLTAIDAAMRAISEDGTTILVSEAVLGNSVPDVTQTVMTAVNSRLGMQQATSAPSASQSLPKSLPLMGLPPASAAPVPDVSMPASDAPAAANPFEAPPK